MKYRFVLTLFCIAHFCNDVCSQADSVITALNQIYLELAGTGGYGSVNYERVILKRNNFGLTGRLGLSTYHFKDFEDKVNPDLIIPFSIHGYYGRKSKIEIGFGQTIANIVHAEFPEFSIKRKTDFHTHFCIGYRYQRINGGFTFRCVYTPIIEFNRYFRHWAGCSVGYSF